MTLSPAEIHRLLVSPDIFKVAVEVHRRLPEVRAEFLKRFADRLSIRIVDTVQGHGELKCVHGVSGFDKPRWQGISLFRDGDAWKVGAHQVTICLQAQGRGPQNWIIGVAAGIGMIRDTVAPLERALGRQKASQWWPWYEFVADRWRWWYDVAPALARETEEDGDATRYFLDRFREICEHAIPIIDDAVRRARSDERSESRGPALGPL